MTPEAVIGLTKDAIQLTLLVSMPLLGLGLIVGLAISVFQATTHIQEMTIAFIPKIVVVFLGMLFFAPWMLKLLTEFGQNCITKLPIYIK